MTQKWYADDGSIVGKLKDIRELFDKLTELGPKYRYLVNPPKCQLIIKPGGERQASPLFAGTSLEITQGTRVLNQLSEALRPVKIFWKMQNWIRKHFVQFALTYPRMVMHDEGVQQKLSFLWRTTSSMDGV